MSALPTHVRVIGDGLSPYDAKLIDAATGLPIVLPITRIEGVFQVGEPNRVIITLGNAVDMAGRAVWQIEEDDLRALAAANGFDLVKRD